MLVSFQNWKSKGRTRWISSIGVNDNCCFNAISIGPFSGVIWQLYKYLALLLTLKIGNGSIFKKKRRDGVATFSFLEEVFHLTKQSYPAARCYRCHEEEGVSFHFDIKKQIKGKGDQTPHWGGAIGEITIVVSVRREGGLVICDTSAIAQKRAVDNIGVSIHLILWPRRWHELRRTDPSYNLKVDQMFLAMKTRTVWRASGKASIPKRPQETMPFVIFGGLMISTCDPGAWRLWS